VHDFATVGSLTCVECGYALAAAAMPADLPRCPACGGSRFRRTSIFERSNVDASSVETAKREPEWLREERAKATGEARLAFEYEGKPVVHPLPEGWTRIGRSTLADVRLSDPTVSRRHALIVRTDPDGLRALDDRSLNGLFVNGNRVDWARLADGDELEVGRFRLYVLIR